MDLKFQSHYQTASASSPIIHDDTIRDSNSFTPESIEFTAKTQSSKIPSKYTSMKSIESYFAFVRKTPFSLSIENAIPVIPKSSSLSRNSKSIYRE